jgi:spermidine/putrescine-binding protein
MLRSRHQEDDNAAPEGTLLLPQSYNRRDFLRLSGGLAGGALLSACGGAAPSPDQAAPTAAGRSTPSDRASVAAEEGGLAIGSPGNPVEQPLFDDIPAIESGLDAEPGPLRLYNWADYVNKETLDKFAKEFDIEYELTTF